MSDVFQGPGSWMASDGKWYPPEFHPDEAYRNRFAVPVVEPELSPQPVVQMATATGPSEVGQQQQEAPEVGSVQPVQPVVVEPMQPVVVEPERPEVVLAPAPESVATTTHQLPDEAELAAADPHQIKVEQLLARQAEAEHTYQATNAVPPIAHETAEYVVEPRSTTNGMSTPYVAETAELSAAQLEAEMVAVDEQRAALAEAADAAEASPVAPTPESIGRPQESATPTTDATSPAVPTDPAPVEVAEPPAVERQTFSVAPRKSADPVPVAQERPQFTETRPASVVEPPPRQSVGRTEVELDRPPEVPKKSEFRISTAPVTAQPSMSTDLVPYVGPAYGAPSTRDRVVSATLFLSGVALIVGSFLNWTIGDVMQSGWQRGDGIITMVAGVIGSSMAGPIFVGFRHVAPKAVAITVGVVAVIVLGLVAVNSVLGPSASGVDFGLGYFITLAGAAFMILAGVTDKGEEFE